MLNVTEEMFEIYFKDKYKTVYAAWFEFCEKNLYVCIGKL